MPKSKTKRVSKKKPVESDSAYLLKLVMFLLISSMWVRLQYKNGNEIPLPVGAVIALIFASHDHFQIDRKIEYALILVGLFVAFWLPIGIFVSL